MSGKDEYIPDPKEIEEIMLTPFDWLKRKQQELKMRVKKKYFITFTKRNEIDAKKFKKRIAFELQRKFVVSFSVCFEHEDTNLHAHAIIESSRHLRKANDFKTYLNNYGFLDIQMVRNEAAVQQYLEKDGVVHDKIDFI